MQSDRKQLWDIGMCLLIKINKQTPGIRDVMRGNSARSKWVLWYYPCVQSSSLLAKESLFAQLCLFSM